MLLHVALQLRFILFLPRTTTTNNNCPIKDGGDEHTFLFINSHPHPKAAVVFPSLPRCKQALPPTDEPAIKVTKKQLCKDRNYQ